MRCELQNPDLKTPWKTGAFLELKHLNFFKQVGAISKPQK